MKNFIEVTKGTQKLVLNINYIMSYYVGKDSKNVTIMMFDKELIEVKENMYEIAEKIKKAQQ
ncbi:MAG: hypothetical protein E7314_02175 [Clostridiales bacterium]|nr:hypothetical protein [Clostridiales bacterium]